MSGRVLRQNRSSNIPLHHRLPDHQMNKRYIMFCCSLRKSFLGGLWNQNGFCRSPDKLWCTYLFRLYTAPSKHMIYPKVGDVVLLQASVVEQFQNMNSPQTVLNTPQYLSHSSKYSYTGNSHPQLPIRFEALCV